ncbi:hypothetical protein ACFXKD_07555 [Nocardiopsis aegyptia]|uniref:hypothetical protein n=1 Tax=Nocardiopsis aegyptia TaxID=220378 RepID=UPI00366ADD31
MNNESMPSDPDSPDDEGDLNLPDDDLDAEAEDEGRVERDAPVHPRAAQWDSGLGDILRNITKTFQPRPLVSESFMDAIRASKPFEDAFKNVLKIEGLVKPTYDLSHLTDTIEALKPTYDVSWLGDALAAQSSVASLNMALAQNLVYRPPLLAMPPAVTGAMYNDFAASVEDRDADDVESEDVDPEEKSESLAEAVRRDFDTGELSDTEIGSAVEQGVAEYQSLDEDEQTFVSDLAELVKRLHENDQVKIAQTAALIKLEEQKIEAANKRAEEAEGREQEANERARRAENRDKVTLGVTIGSLAITALSVVVAFLALAPG